MKIAALEPDINPDQPFGVHGDNGRLRLAELIINVIKNVSEPTTILLDAKWGDGKTLFLKRLQPLLHNHKIPSIYFDAFKYDYYSDPLMPISGEIANYLDIKSVDKSIQNNFAKSASKLITTVGPKLAGRLAKVATVGLVEATDIEVIKKIGDALADTAEDTTTKLLDEEISNFAAQKAIVSDFRISLGAAAKSLNRHDNKYDKEEAQKSPLVILIDELDRAKPDFALSLLERIKHFFDVANVHFVIAVHSKQLESSIRSVYGEGIDARTYLEKFYSLLLHFPKSNHTGNDELLRVISERQIKAVGVATHNERCIQNASYFLAALANANGWSFRTLQKVSTHVGLSLCNGRFMESIDVTVLCGLWALKITNGPLYERIRNGELIGTEISEALHLELWKYDMSDRMAASCLNVWHLLCGLAVSEEARVSIIDSLGINNVRQFLREFCSNEIDGISEFTVG